MDERDTGTGPAHQPGTMKGEEEVIKRGLEPGREESGDTDEPGGEPIRTRTARDATSVVNAEPIDPASPDMPPA